MKNAKEQYLHVHGDFHRRRPSKNSNSTSINLIHQLRIFLATTYMHTRYINVIELFYISVGWTKLTDEKQEKQNLNLTNFNEAFQYAQTSLPMYHATTGCPFIL